MTEQLIGECLRVPLTCDLPGVLAAYDTTECETHPTTRGSLG